MGAAPPDPAVLTDLANAQRFAAQHGDSVRYVSKWRRWLVWDGKRWADDDTHEVPRRAKDTVQALYEQAEGVPNENERRHRKRLALAAQNAGRIAGLIDLAKSEPGIAITPDQLDADPWRLNVENGTLDLRTGILRAQRPEDLITKLAPVEYSPLAVCATWEAFLDRIMAGKAPLIDYLQRIFGYALTGDAREQCFFILYGVGANGKTTLTNAVSNAVGGYATHTPTETLLVRRSDAIPNDVARLHGARLVTAAETECNRALAEALVKQLTGGDKIAARFLHAEWFEFDPTFKLFLAVNHKPLIKGTDHGIWRRIRLIPFDVTIPDSEQDKRLPEKLEAERSGILRWAVEGCLAWQARGLEPPKAVTEATASYRDEMDSVGAFIDECCIRDANATTPTKDLYARYVEWSGVSDDSPLPKTEFGSRLAEKGFTPGRTKALGRLWRGLAVVTQ